MYYMVSHCVVLQVSRKAIDQLQVLTYRKLSFLCKRFLGAMRSPSGAFLLHRPPRWRVLCVYVCVWLCVRVIGVADLLSTRPRGRIRRSGQNVDCTGTKEGH